MMYKRVLISLIAIGSFAVAKSECGMEFMYDPCASNGYSIVEAEEYVKPPHNWMESAHFDKERGHPHHYSRYHHRHSKGKYVARASTPVAKIK